MQADAEMEQKDGKGNRPLDRAIALGSVEVTAIYFYYHTKLLKLLGLISFDYTQLLKLNHLTCVYRA